MREKLPYHTHNKLTHKQNIDGSNFIIVYYKTNINPYIQHITNNKHFLHL